MREFLKTTIIGGVVFILPLILISVAVAYALRMARGAVEPLLPYIALDGVGQFLGLGLATLLSAVILVAVAFLGGIVARTALGERLSSWVERSFLGRSPQYQMIRSLAGGFAQIQKAEGLKPVLASVEDGCWQIGYHVDTLEDGWLAIFIPAAPTPMSGDLLFFPAERIRPLDVTMLQTSLLIQKIGLGAASVVGRMPSLSETGHHFLTSKQDIS